MLTDSKSAKVKMLNKGNSLSEKFSQLEVSSSDRNDVTELLREDIADAEIDLLNDDPIELDN
jgi:hypothetical protein